MNWYSEPLQNTPLIAARKEQFKINSELCDKNYKYFDGTPLTKEVAGAIFESKTAKELIFDVENYDICYDIHTNISYFDKERNVLCLCPNPDEVNILYTPLFMIRLINLVKKGIYKNFLDYVPDDAVLINRFLWADCHAHVIKCMYELSYFGQSIEDDTRALWYNISRCDVFYNRAAGIYEDFVKNDFTTMLNGEAMLNLFVEFFDERYLNNIDKRTISFMLNYEQYMMNGNLKELKHHELKLFGETPFCKNYLGFSNLIKDLKSPSFTIIQNRSNANFLWFIKFEHSFLKNVKEKEFESFVEQETQKDDNVIFVEFGKKN